jgi:hypothetical protein
MKFYKYADESVMNQITHSINSHTLSVYMRAVAHPGIFSGGVQQIQLRTEGRENGDLGAVAP